MKETIVTNGYVVLPPVLSENELEAISRSVASLALDGAGSRNILEHEWCQLLARHLRSLPSVSLLLPKVSVAVQCTYFAKSPSKNWLVAPHRDQFIPVKCRVESSGWSGWSIKEGTPFVRAPFHVLQSLVAIRLHLEENTILNGPLMVVPQSHIRNDASEEAVACIVEKGGVVAMNPMVLHSSSKVLQGTRRVLHFLYGPPVLPDEIEWRHAV